MTLTAVPDTGIARGAAALVIASEPPFLVNHSERTFRLGGQLLDAADRAFDPELLYVASMLHDIALGTQFDDDITPFHLTGAAIAAKYEVDADRPVADASLVFDAIALHLELTTAGDTRPEVAGVHLGAAADVAGLRLDQIDPELHDAIVAESPRLGMKQAFIEVIRVEAQHKPYSAAAALIRSLGFLDFIKNAPFDE
jgi:HD domain